MFGIQVEKTDIKSIKEIYKIFQILNTYEYNDTRTCAEVVLLQINIEDFLTLWDLDSVKNLLKRDTILLKCNGATLLKGEYPEFTFEHGFTKHYLKMQLKLDKEWEMRRKSSPFEITKDYINDHKTESDLSGLSLSMLNTYIYGYADFDNKNVLLIDTAQDIDLITKKSLFLPTSTAISFKGKKSIQIDHYRDYEYYCYLPEEKDIKTNWFTKVKPLLYNGLLEYIPNIVIDECLPDGTNKVVDEHYIIKTKECSADTDETNNINFQLKSLNINIPFIQNIPLSDFSSIAVNNGDSLEAYQLFFQKSINNIDFSKSKEILDFELTMQEKVREINNSLSIEFLKAKKNIMIGLLTTTLTATLLIFNNYHELVNCLVGISGTGGLIKFFSDVYDYQIETHKIKNNECYFLWLMRKCMKKIET